MKPRQIKGGCWKKAYSKRSHAEDALEVMKLRNTQDAKRLIVYRCPRCDRYHLGRDNYR